MRETLAVLRHDRVAQIAFLLFGAAAGCSLVVSAPFRAWIDWRPLLVLFLTLDVIALRHRLAHVENPRERQFWRRLSYAFGMWWSASVAIAVFDSAAAETFSYLAYTFYYIAWILAIELAPERRPAETHDPRDRLLSTPTIPIFVVGLLVYFKLLPLFSKAASTEAASVYLYLTLDLYLLIRLAVLSRQAASRRWRVLWGGLLVYYLTMTFSDFLGSAGVGPSWLWEEQFLFLWVLPHLFFIVAVRSRHRLDSLRSEDLAPELPPGTGWQTMICAMLLPLIHSLLYAFHLLDLNHQDARHLWMVVWLLLIGGIGLLQNRWYEHSRQRLVAGQLSLGEELAWHHRVEAEREQFIRQLQAKNQEMDHFTSTVAHDLKAPLVTLEGFVGFLERDLAADNRPRIDADLQEIYGAIHGMQGLLMRLLDLARAGLVVSEPKPVPLAALLPEAVARVRGRLEQQDVVVRIAPDLPTVEGDSDRLLEVFQNLIDNAAKFMGDQAEPRIEIGHFREKGCVVMFVRDNGRGIDQEDQERVFDTFFGDQTVQDSTGLGLSLVRRIVAAHRGRIWCEPNTSRQGTTFFVRFSDQSDGAD